MPLGSLLTALAATLGEAILAPPQTSTFIELPAPVLTAESAVMTKRTAPPARPTAVQDPDYPVVSPPNAEPPPDLAMYVGDRQTGPQLELGAFGGGKVSARGLVHVGFGMDF
jgi:hypothetical protein